MAHYKIIFKKTIHKDVLKIPKKDLKRIFQRIELLATDPRPLNVVNLSGNKKYRLRQGNYRILYRVDDQQVIIYVVKIAHRRHVYQNS